MKRLYSPVCALLSTKNIGTLFRRQQRTRGAQRGLRLIPVSPFTNSSILMSSKGWIFVAGVVALALSLYLWFSGSKQAGIFVGLWVPSLWILADLVEKTETADT